MITGASRGIGAALASSFAAAGAQVALVARSEAAITELAERLGGRAYPADLADREQVRDLVARVEADGGPIDVLVNNAGLEDAGDFARQSEEAVEAMLAVNLVAAVQLTRQVVPGMLERGGGHIVNVSSMGAASVFPGLAVYSATKAGLSHFTAGLARLSRPADRHDPARAGSDDDRHARRSQELPTDAGGVRARLPVARLRRHPARAGRRGNGRSSAEGRRYVRLPTRAALFPVIAELPRRLTEVMLKGSGAKIR